MATYGRGSKKGVPSKSLRPGNNKDMPKLADPCVLLFEHTHIHVYHIYIYLNILNDRLYIYIS